MGNKSKFWYIIAILCAVERRRRDRINELIKTLAQLVPGCQKKDASTGTIIGVSQPTCLTRACPYMVVL